MHKRAFDDARRVVDPLPRAHLRTVACMSHRLPVAETVWQPSARGAARGNCRITRRSRPSVRKGEKEGPERPRRAAKVA